MVKLWLLLMPVVSCLLGVLFLHETLTARKALGTAVVLLGAALILLRGKLNTRKTEDWIMDMLDSLREKNPNLPLWSVFDPAFAPYGRVLPVRDPASLKAALAQTAIPEKGNQYTASLPLLEATPDVRRLADTVYGGMAVQAGCCNGHGFTLNAEEYHKCSEVNYSTTGLVLLLALPSDIRDRTLDAAKAVGFYLPPEVMVEIYPLVLHFAPCRVRPEGFNCLVVLTAGTNTPLDRVDTAAPGEEGLLWMRNKWLLCHPDSPQAQNGAFVGITGENLTLAIE